MTEYQHARKLPLFDVPKAQEHSKPSRDAAVLIESVAGKLRRRVHDEIIRCAESGATDQEIQNVLRMDPSTERPRRVELVDAGRVVDSGRTRFTVAGRQATVWVGAEWRPSNKWQGV